MHRLERIAHENDGVIPYAAAREAGFDPHALVDRGLLVRLRRGSYLLRAVHDVLSPAALHVQSVRDALARRDASYVASHDSAVILHGLVSDALDLPDGRLDLEAAHLSRTRGATSRRRNAVHIHRRTVGEDDVVLAEGLPTVSVPLAVAQVLTCRPLAVGAVVASAYLAHLRAEARARGALDRFDELAAKTSVSDVLASLGRSTGMRDARDALEIADSRCDNAAEVLVLLVCWQFGLPRPRTQYVIDLDRGHAEVDFCWPDVRLVLEFDGKKKYADEVGPDGRVTRTGQDKLFAEKKREDAIRRRHYEVERVTWADLLPANRARTARRIRAALARAAAAARA